MARKSSKTETKKENFKEFKFDGKEFQFTGRIYPDLSTETKACTITPMSLTLNSVLTIKGCRLFQTDDKAWIAGPDYKAKDGNYKNYLYWDKEYNAEMDELVKAVEAALEA